MAVGTHLGTTLGGDHTDILIMDMLTTLGITAGTTLGIMVTIVFMTLGTHLTIMVVSTITITHHTGTTTAGILVTTQVTADTTTLPMLFTHQGITLVDQCINAHLPQTAAAD